MNPIGDPKGCYARARRLEHRIEVIHPMRLRKFGDALDAGRQAAAWPIAEELRKLALLTEARGCGGPLRPVGAGIRRLRHMVSPMATPHRPRRPSGPARRKNHLFAGSDGSDRWGGCRFSPRHGPTRQRRALPPISGDVLERMVGAIRRAGSKGHVQSRESLRAGGVGHPLP